MNLKKIIKKLRILIFDFYEKSPRFGKLFVIGWRILHKTKFYLKKAFIKSRKKGIDQKNGRPETQPEDGAGTDQ